MVRGWESLYHYWKLNNKCGKLNWKPEMGSRIGEGYIQKYSQPENAKSEPLIWEYNDLEGVIWH